MIIAVIAWNHIIKTFLLQNSSPSVGGDLGMLTAAPELRLGFLIKAGGANEPRPLNFFFSSFFSCLVS